ncbi:MAG: SDR family oxidoreductase [Sinimarinibacterium flocculans]|uniref:SDR family oxidoreductase n=1 Tax=Sinimarinibacterium flocculans TaxID=985250 RepID=UPI003C682F3F
MSAQRIFITGGASGLGRALAERYARAGWRVCVGDIDDAAGSETAGALAQLGGDAHYLHCDVTRDADFEAAAAWLREHWGGVDVVVNNAGVAAAGGIAEMPMQDWLWSVDINLLGVVRGCRSFTPLLRAQGGGHLVNIASMAGLIHAPMMAAYNATKAGVVALSETLKIELAPDGIDVSVVCPGFFRTGIARNMRATGADVKHITHKLVDRAKTGADEIARQIFDGVARGDFHILTHADGRMAWRIKRHAPYRWYAALMARQTRGMMRPRGAGIGA